MPRYPYQVRKLILRSALVMLVVGVIFYRVLKSE